MKKIALFSLLVCCLGFVGNSFGGDVLNSCTVTQNCGARDEVMWQILGGSYGAVNGAITGLVMGPFGSAAGAVAGGYIGLELGGVIGRAYKANEYIYFKDGTCLECDSHQVGEDYECPHLTVVTNGYKAYQCRVEGDGDYWTEYEIPVCSDSPVKPSNVSEYSKYNTVLRDNVTNNGVSVKSGILKFSSAVCLYITGEKKETDCPYGQRRATQNIALTDLCSGDLCTPIIAGKCYPENFLDCMIKINNGESVWWNGKKCLSCDGDCKRRTKSCVESRTTAEGKACCYVPESEAKWDGKNCKCSDANATFKIDANGRGKCETNQSPVDNTPGNCWYMFRADMQCANGNSYVGEKKYLLTESDLNGQTCETFLKLYQNDATKMLELFNKFCNSQGSLQVINITPVGPNAAEVSNAKDTLNKFFANAESEASVWKDSEGKFNTARLASDLTAGVVLGTVGGVVSGVVIKKKQVEKGFEVLHCAVGGQKIADWGDEFSVGLQR